MKKFLSLLRDIVVMVAILMIINLIMFVVFGIAPIDILGSVILSLVIRGIAGLARRKKEKA